MRRRPEGRPDHVGEHVGPSVEQSPEQRADLLEPLLACSDYAYWPFQDEVFDPRPAGAQLVLSQYIPTGRCAWIHALHVAPYCPAELADPWWTGGGYLGATWGAGSNTERTSGQHGLWATPKGWEIYYNAPDAPPAWSWSLRLVKGDIAQLRRHHTNLQPFDISDPATWYLAPYPVPASVYATSGIPGRAPSGYFHGGSCQILPHDSLPMQIFVPQDTTICLFSQWTQIDIYPYARDVSGRIEYGNYRVYPILPTFGRIAGVVQKLDSAAAVDNATTAR